VSRRRITRGADRLRVFAMRRLGLSTRAIARHLAVERSLPVSHETVAKLLRRSDPLVSQPRPFGHRCAVCWRPTRNG